MAVKFKEDGHLYSTVHDNKPLLSVSGFMHQFEPKKDWNKIAAKVAKKQETTVKAVLALWDLKRNKGSEAGTIIHKIKENELLSKNGEIVIKESPYDSDYKYSLDIQQLDDNTTYPELMIYDLDFGICGQSDEVEIRKGVIEVRDHKTDKSIDTRAFSSEWVEAERYLKPIHHLEVCNFNTYSLKMSLYMYLIWKANKGRFKPGKIILNWCPIERDEEGIPILYSGVPKILFEQQVEVPYRKREVMAMLATLKK